VAVGDPALAGGDSFVEQRETDGAVAAPGSGSGDSGGCGPVEGRDVFGAAPDDGLLQAAFKSSGSAALCWLRSSQLSEESSPRTQRVRACHPAAAPKNVASFDRSASARIARSTPRCGHSAISFSLFHKRITTSKCRITDSHSASRFRERERSSCNWIRRCGTSSGLNPRYAVPNARVKQTALPPAHRRLGTADRETEFG